MHKPMEELFTGLEIIKNPTQDQLREMALKTVPAIYKTKYGNLMRVTRLKARKAERTYIIAPESEAEKYSSKVISKEKAQKYIDIQKEYISKKGKLIQIDAYLGSDPAYAVPVQWVYTEEGANLAGMQQTLSFPREMVETEEQLKKPFEPKFRLIMTPGCPAKDLPEELAIIVDLDNWTTYVLNSDYFGESKKGMLRMLNLYAYQKGGLVLHAGAKSIKTKDQLSTMAVLGLSGTGKTTTTFSKQGELTQPIQDDMIIMWPGGKISITENGCFAKTYGLTRETEPVIYEGTVKPTAWIENVYMDMETKDFDFAKDLLNPKEVEAWKDMFILLGESEANINDYIYGKVNGEDVLNEFGLPKDGWNFVRWTENGRSIIPMAEIKDAADFDNIPSMTSIGLLNRDEGQDAATPGIIRFPTPEQAAAYFMLGETSKTSAAGKERGKTRSPFTQPFFPLAMGLQAVRFSELVKTMDNLQTWMMNTGYIGGDAEEEKKGTALKVKIRHSSAMLEALIAESIVWKKDPDFGYEIVDVDHPDNKQLLEKVPAEILNPIIFYQKNNRMEEYKAWVKKMKAERVAFLEKFKVDPKIVETVK